MSKIKWCLKQKCGIKFVEPNKNLSESYLSMAKESLDAMSREKGKSKIFSVSAAYYSLYYSLYSIMQKIGIKCEIHSCSIDFMKNFLMEFYNSKDIELIESAFRARNDLQYYVNRDVSLDNLSYIFDNSYDFFVKSRKIVSLLSESKINKIRGELENAK
jgi:uncharacterized protein (UPF0332 family)